MQKIEHNGKIISIIYRDDDRVEGLNFITPNELFVQVFMVVSKRRNTSESYSY